MNRAEKLSFLQEQKQLAISGRKAVLDMSTSNPFSADAGWSVRSDRGFRNRFGPAQPLKGKVEGKSTERTSFVRSLSGIGHAGSLFWGQSSLNQPISESRLMRRTGRN